MPYELNFTQEFFALSDETNGMQYSHDKTPYSVWGALKVMPENEWQCMCIELFPNHPRDHVTIDMVMDMIKETNTCGSLSSPVDVWIDPEGCYTVDVYDCNGRPR